jgi:hypothetical protein
VDGCLGAGKVADALEGSPNSWPDEAGFVGDDHGLDSVPDAKLGENSSDVAFHCAFTEIYLLSDLSVRQPPRDQAEYLALAGSEVVKPGLIREICGFGGWQEAFDQPAPAAQIRGLAVRWNSSVAISPRAPARTGRFSRAAPGRDQDLFARQLPLPAPCRLHRYRTDGGVCSHARDGGDRRRRMGFPSGARSS